MPHRSLALALLLLCVSTTSAHYNMLLPGSASARRGHEVMFIYQWGHPFEHQLFDAPRPARLVVIGPGGVATDLTDKLGKVNAADGKRVTTYRLRFTPKERGDFAFILHTPPIWMADEEVFFEDTVKVVLHVQVQNGWDRPAKQSFEMLPLTRPYGLEAGTVFQAQVLAAGKPAPASLVEIERYNAEPPPKLPPDEFITRTARTDANGVVTTTLADPGWWAITAQRAAGQRLHDGKLYPVLGRTTLWVAVADRAARR